MQFTEKEIEDLIYQDLFESDGQTLSDRGLKTFYLEATSLFENSEISKSTWLRQLNLGPYGILDLIGYYHVGETMHIEILELKIVDIKSEDFDQLLRYENGVRLYFKGKFPEMDIRTHLYLIGPAINSGHFIHNRIHNLVVCEYEFTLSGLKFNTSHGGWIRSGYESFDLFKSIQNAEKIYGY